MKSESRGINAHAFARFVHVRNRQRHIPIRTDPYRTLLCQLLLLTVRQPVEVGLTFVSDRQIRRLNATYRNHDTPTDVLAFPPSPVPVPHGRVSALGDIVISVETARRQASPRSKRRAGGQTLLAECRRLLIHGYLHLLGYDHERSAADARRMRRMERQLSTMTRRGQRALRVAAPAREKGG